MRKALELNTATVGNRAVYVDNGAGLYMNTVTRL